MRKRRAIKIVLISAVALFVLIAIVLLVGFFKLRSLASERSTPVDGRYFVTPDTSLFILARLKPSDEGVLEFSNRLTKAYDANREDRAGLWEDLAYFALGFDQPSDVITRPLPAEVAVVVRYDPHKAEFHSYAVYSISGLAALARFAARNLSLFAPEAAESYGQQTHSDETVFVPENAAGPPGPRLAERDIEALVPPAALSEACWSVIENNILFSRRVPSLSLAVDDVKAVFAGAAQTQHSPIAEVVPSLDGGVDITGGLINEHGELACVLSLVGKLIDAKDMATWLRAEGALRDVSTITRVGFSADIRRGDRIVVTIRFAYTSHRSALRVASVLVKALTEWKPPPPVQLWVGPGLESGRVRIKAILSGVGEYLEQAVKAPTAP